MSALEPAPMTEEATLNYTQKVRRDLVEDITQGGTRMPTDAKDRMALLAAVDGMDRVAISKLRLRSEDKHTEAIKAASAVIANVMSGLSDKGDIFAVGQVIEHGEAPLPRHPEKLLTEVVIAPGELDQGIADMQYDTFIEEQESRDVR